MRAGRAADLEAVRELWGRLASLGQREPPPPLETLRRLLSGFDWSSRSRLALDQRGCLAGFVMVSDRPTEAGKLARIEVGAADPCIDRDLLTWGLQAARQELHADLAGVWRRRGSEPLLPELGFRVARPFWRLDRWSLEELPQQPWPESYRLVSYATAGMPDAAWLDAFNSAFAGHWRHSPAQFASWRRRLSSDDTDIELYLMALDAQRRPAAIAICFLREPDEWQARPIGVVESLGTVPGHRRRGLGSALTVEGLRRLRDRGAKGASLYVDGLNSTRAYDIYYRLGFRLGWEYDVWERELD